MNIPNKIRIGGHTIEVRITGTKEEKDFGSYDNWFRIIRINNAGINEDTQAETFLHEILEASTRIYNLEDRLDHDTLSILSQLLFAVFRDNQLDFSGGVLLE